MRTDGGGGEGCWTVVAHGEHELEHGGDDETHRRRVDARQHSAPHPTTPIVHCTSFVCQPLATPEHARWALDTMWDCLMSL